MRFHAKMISLIVITTKKTIVTISKINVGSLNASAREIVLKESSRGSLEMLPRYASPGSAPFMSVDDLMKTLTNT